MTFVVSFSVVRVKVIPAKYFEPRIHFVSFESQTVTCLTRKGVLGRRGNCACHNIGLIECKTSLLHTAFPSIKRSMKLFSYPSLSLAFFNNVTVGAYCSASEVRHPSEVRHLHFMTILKSFYCPVTAYM